jgi:uncharacterized membrane protein
MALLSQAEKLFSNGDYVNARQQAENAIINMDAKGSIPSSSSSSSSFSSPDVSSQGTLTNMVIVVATITASVGIIIAMLFVIKKRKKPSLTATRLIGKKQDNNNSAIPKSEQGKVNDSSISSRSNQSLDVRPADHYLSEHKQYPSSSSSSSPLSPVPINPQQSNIDQTALLQKVLKIIEENQQLKVEDHQVLRFLAENQGAAFESEIRNKFQQLPKTTIWRLVKRLEREELIEIRKAAGQNLIKLRFENNVQ